ncbi:hypothetical protein R1flu_000439 [Riccia fluitans]|uniref:Uncharacterized protein n=1 Tax=Riccia fluitans TaxID=41844 RepID=A0ABD1Y0G1_9MARC
MSGCTYTHGRALLSAPITSEVHGTWRSWYLWHPGSIQIPPTWEVYLDRIAPSTSVSPSDSAYLGARPLDGRLSRLLDFVLIVYSAAG